MNKLSCSVSSCLHNSTGLCCLNEILVDGPGARKSENTSCVSFTERGMGAHNSMGECGNHPSQETAVDCKAHNCSYNENAKCHARQIKVGCCCSEPRSCGDTECCTFTQG